MDHEGGHAKLQIADWSRLPDSQMLQSELKQVLDQAISELPENFRSVILLRDVEELSTLELGHGEKLAGWPGSQQGGLFISQT